MSDYLPSWTDDNFFMLIELMGGDPGGGPGGGPGLIAPGLTPGQKPKNPEQPCIDRGKNVRAFCAQHASLRPGS